MQLSARVDAGPAKAFKRRLLDEDLTFAGWLHVAIGDYLAGRYVPSEKRPDGRGPIWPNARSVSRKPQQPEGEN